MADELPIGTRRVGLLIDFDPDTPEIDVILRRTKKGIFLDIPWRPSSNVYSRWFLTSNLFDGDTESIPVPDVLLFRDSKGEVLVVGCRAQTYHTNFSSGIGVLRANYAVLGHEQSKFDLVDRLRWEVSGLRRWLGVTSIAASRGPGSTNRTEIVVQPGERIQVEQRDDFALVPIAWWDHGYGDASKVLDLLVVETILPEAGRWHEHSSIPRRLRDLLSISQWVTATYQVNAASRDDDPLKTMDGTIHGRLWRKVVDGSSQPPATKPREFPHELIEYGDLGPGGLIRWLELSEQFARVIDPIVSQTIVRDAFPSGRLAQTGPAIEALGYFLCLEDGMPEDKAASLYLRARFQRVADVVREVVPFDVEEWVRRAPDIYNGLKHANRQQPDDVEVLNVWGECVLAVRAWVALRLGVEPSKLRDRLERDPQSYKFVAVPPS